MNRIGFFKVIAFICIINVVLSGTSNMLKFDKQTASAADNNRKFLYVGEGQPFKSISDAVYAAVGGDTVFIKSGTYSDSILIDKGNITVQGEDIKTTSIINNSKDPVINVSNTTGVTIKGLSLKNTDNCISIKNSKDLSITQCKIESTVSGIKADKSSGKITIDDCEISGAVNGYGIESSADIISVTNSNIFNNDCGIDISSNSDVLIENNRINNNKHNGCVLKDISNLICQNNTINSSSIGIEWRTSIYSEQIKTGGKIINNELYFNKNYGISFGNVCNILIEKNNVYHNDTKWGYGINFLGYSNNNTITGNTIFNYYNCIFLENNSSENRIYKNDFINSDARDNSINRSNIWSVECKGNYWSNYNGEDKNEDGIGDTPFVIKSALNVNPQDDYPLMKQQYTFVVPSTPPTSTPTTRPTPKSTSTSIQTSTPTPNSTLIPESTVTPTPLPSLNPVTSVEPSGTTQNTISIPVSQIPAANIATPTPDVSVPTATPTATPSIQAKPTPVPSNLPTDTKSHWAKEYIDLVVSKGIMGGKGAGVFSPEDYTTRAECAKVTVELIKKFSNNVESDKFSDVSKNDWFYPYVYSAYNEGIMIGNPNNAFLPDKPVTRQDLALIFSKILIKYCSLEEVKALTPASIGAVDSNREADISELKGKIELPYSDTSSISKYALDGVATVSNYGLFTGKPGNLFDPKGKTTRAELATILYKLITKYKLQ